MKSRIAVVCCAAFLVTPVLQAATPAEVKAAIESHFQLTTRSGMTGRVSKPGTVMVVQQEGFRADKPNSFMRPSIVKGGSITTVGGGSPMFGGNTGHALKVGERLHLYTVKPDKNYVVLTVATVDTFDVVEKGNTMSIPYQAAVSFQFGGGLAAVSADDVLNAIGAWLKTEGESAAASTKTIALGQTPEQVVSVLGPPAKKIELGPKTIYTYPDMKVVSMNGKVSDVQ